MIKKVPGDTTNISIVDNEGNAVGVTTTLGGGFGTGIVMGNTGLLCNNGLRTGSTAPYRDHPNFVKGDGFHCWATARRSSRIRVSSR